MKNILRLAARLFLGAAIYEKIQFRRHTGYWPNLKEPRTFNEHLCKRKLDKDFSESIQYQDKVAVRDYVRAKIGEAYLTKCYQVIDSIANLDYEKLPKSFVAKGTNACGEDSIFIVDDKSTLSEEQVISKLKKILSRDSNIFSRFYYYTNEWWYERIPIRLLVEEHLSPGKGVVPLDYKFFVFHGRVHYIQVDFGRFVNHTRSLYDRDWNLQNFRLGYPKGPDIARPEGLDEMISVAEALGDHDDFLRIDLYQLDDGRVVFGEITVCPSLGHARFDPPEWDRKFGQIWNERKTDR